MKNKKLVWLSLVLSFLIMVSNSVLPVVPLAKAQSVTPAFSFQIGDGIWGSNDVELASPHGVAVDGDGNIYVTDADNNRVDKFDSSGVLIGAIGKVTASSGTCPASGTTSGWCTGGTFAFGSDDGQFNYPVSIALDISGNIYIGDWRNRIQKFNPAGVYQSQFGNDGVSPRTDNGQLNIPYGISVDASGNIYVADTYNMRIQKFNSSEAWQWTLGGDGAGFQGSGTGDGQFFYPWGVVIDATGDNIYVVDQSNRRIQKISSAGVYQSQFSTTVSGDGSNYPNGIALDASGNIYVADGNTTKIKKFTSSGDFIYQFGGSGSGPGQFSSDEQGVAVDAAGNVYVADTWNSRVEVFSLSTAPAPSTSGTGNINIDCTPLGAGHYTVQHSLQLSNDGVDLGDLTTLAFQNRDFRFHDSFGANTAAPVNVLTYNDASANPVEISAPYLSQALAIKSVITSPNNLSGTGCPSNSNSSFTVTVASPGLRRAADPTGTAIPVMFKDSTVCAAGCDLNSTLATYDITGVNFNENQPRNILSISITPASVGGNGFTAFYDTSGNPPLLTADTYAGEITVQINPTLI